MGEISKLGWLMGFVKVILYIACYLLMTECLVRIHGNCLTDMVCLEVENN